jgi:hypothetical protein
LLSDSPFDRAASTNEATRRLAWLVSACVLFVYLLVLSARQHHLLTRATDLLQHNAESNAQVPNSPRQQPENWSAAMDAFVARENVARYKRMLEMSNEEATRQVLKGLLAEAESKLVRENRPAS